MAASDMKFCSCEKVSGARVGMTSPTSPATCASGERGRCPGALPGDADDASGSPLHQPLRLDTCNNAFIDSIPGGARTVQILLCVQDLPAAQAVSQQRR